MICSNCGAKALGNINFCTECGTSLVLVTDDKVNTPGRTEPAEGSGSLIGYSERINDPAFARYQRNTTIWAFAFSTILALVVIISFYIYGERSYEMDNPEALFIGMGIGGMFLAIALLTTISRASGSTYDAVLIDKKIEKKRRRQQSGDDYYMEKYTLYTLTFKTDQGKIKTMTAEDDDTKYNYYKIGDKVRHHQGLNSWEKYDKSGDSIIFCNACGDINDINDDKCHRCYCPLLK